MLRVKLWNQKELDYRVMQSFRNALFGSPYLTQEKKVPISEFVRIRNEHDNHQINS